MTALADFERATEAYPLVAISRPTRPDEVDAIGDMLLAARFALIEGPLFSLDPLRSVARKGSTNMPIARTFVRCD